jgi:hypothetical protein
MDGTTNLVGQLFLRTPDGAVYGPVDMVTLCAWATDARIIPGCALSADKVEWKPAETYPELRLKWMVQLPDGTSYGPLNLLAIWALAEEASIHRGSTILERTTGRQALLDESSLPLIIEETRLMLSGGGVLASGIMEVLKANRKGEDEALSARDQQILALRSTIEGLEGELAASLKLVGESQRYLVNQEDASMAAETHVRAAHEARAERDAQQLKLAETEQRLDAVERKLRESILLGQATERTLVEAGSRLEASEAQRIDLSARLKAAEQGTGRVGDELREVLDREQDHKRRHASEVERLSSEAERLTGELDKERAARLSSEQAGEAVVAALKNELDQWDGKFQTALVGVRKMEADLRGREEAFTAFRHQSERTEAELTAKVAALRKETESALRRIQELTDLHEQDQREIVQAGLDGEARVQVLKEELAAVQRDLSGLLMASDCVRQASGERETPSGPAINWLDHGRDEPSADGARLSPAEQLEILSRKMRESADENETLRRTVEGLRDNQDAVRIEAQEKILQLQQQARASSGMVQQALEEIERREAQMRSVRKKAEDRERELMARIDELEKTERDVVVVEPEVISPRDWGSSGGVARGMNPAVDAEAPDGHNLLDSVEAQLRSELKKWETLSRKRGTQAKNWFARK